MLGPSTEEIVELLQTRQRARGGVVATMRQLRDTYNGDVIIPMPEMDKSEKPAVANLITIGLDQTAMRIASTMPNIFYPPVKEGFKQSEDLARSRTNANVGWWEVNKMQLLMRQRSRFLVGYSSAPVLLRPDKKWGCPKWELKSPLDTYASTGSNILDITPDNVIFVSSHSLSWFKREYPDHVNILKRNRLTEKPDDRVDIAEYNDAEVTVLIAMSRAKDDPFGEPSAGQATVELARIANLAGICLGVVPSRITLDKPMGQFDSQVGMYELQAKLMALEVIAVERNIFPDQYLVSRPGEQAKFITGPHDGRTGNVNVIQGGIMDVKTPIPNQMTNMTIDRLERNMRVMGGTPAEYGGESSSNVRTGKRGDAIMSATIDFQIQEAQDVFAASLQEENKRAVAIAMSYFGSKHKSFYISTQGFKGNVGYTPELIFENDNNVVTYSHSGADANALVVGLGQRIGIGTMSKQTAREIDPLISNAEQERDRVTSESLQAALLQSIQAQAQQGTIPPADLARIAILVKTNKKELAEAIEQVQKESQERQAKQAPAGAAETMPGLAQPGMGAEQASVAPPTPGSSNLAQLLSTLKSPNTGAPVA